ncbi:MAG: ABC transporter ATP-binding protein [Holophagales bacterium]|nr:ABC transporter ATP-binding protein [Holophagales bacterium]
MNEESRPVIELWDLQVRYGPTTLLDGIDLEVRSGDVCALVGRNGVGKSSLVRCLLGQQRPTGGRAHLFGLDVWRHRSRLMEGVGVVPEEPDAPPSMSAAELARFCRRLYSSWDQAGYDARLERFGVPTRVPFSSLSKGQKAQVMMALALAPSPSLLVLDDPTLGLDVVARNAFFEELVDVLAERGTTVLLTSHDLPGIERVAVHIALLQEGKICLHEELEQLKARHRRLSIPTDLGLDPEPMAPIAERARARRREILVSRFDPELFAAWTDAHGTGRLHSEPLPLDELLLHLVDSEGPS